MMTSSADSTAADSTAAAENDRRLMKTALDLARRGLGRTWPNPAVGCVLARFPSGERASAEGGAPMIVGRGWTQSGGRPHAETEALRRAGPAARGATAYVSLEPCSHYGKTPPCADALIAAGVTRCVVACQDPDPRVSGAGIARLRAAGVAVTSGVLANEARALNQGFFLRIQRNRPMFTLKLATTLDGRIATHAGHSRWITGPVARAWGHELRARHDAIMVGCGTAIADDPDLTCRLPGMAPRSPVRIVVDSHLRTPLTGRLVRTARDVPTWIITRQEGDPARRRVFKECGVELIPTPVDAEGRLDLDAACADLAERGLTRVLVEGGSRLAADLVRRRLADRLEWFRSARLIGGDGLPALAGFGVERLDQTADFVCVSTRRAGEDGAESYVRVENAA